MLGNFNMNTTSDDLEGTAVILRCSIFFVFYSIFCDSSVFYPLRRLVTVTYMSVILIPFGLPTMGMWFYLDV